jgi:stage III sporulation protein AG
MDISELRNKAVELIKKYRYVILVLAIGIVLMTLPEKVDREETLAVIPEKTGTFTDQTEALTQILSQIQGAGKVKVLLSVHAGEKTLYQTDQDTSTGEDSGTLRYETVIVTDSDRAQHALVQQLVAPEYRVAIVVCQGADDVSVRLAIVEAVSDATGLGTDRISVLKMK